MRKLKPTFILMALEKELKEHDWTFNMSDDQECWRNGTGEQKIIRQMVEDAYVEGCDRADLFFEYYPMDGCDAPRDYGIKRSWEEHLDNKAQAFNNKETIQ